MPKLGQARPGQEQEQEQEQGPINNGDGDSDSDGYENTVIMTKEKPSSPDKSSTQSPTY